MDVNEILEIKGDKVFVVHPDNTVAEAAGALVAGHIGALLVVDGRPTTAHLILIHSASALTSSSVTPG